MPRNVARDGYTAAQVLERIKLGHGVLEPAFEVTDLSHNHIKWLDGVTAARISWDASRVIPRSLRMEMLPDSDLVGVPWLRLIRCWMHVGMGGPRRDRASFPCGSFVWIEPARRIEEPGPRDKPQPETWSVVLGDQMHFLDDATVGPVAFRNPAGTPHTTAIIKILLRNAIDDFTGVDVSPLVLPDDYTVSMRTGAQRSRWTRQLVDTTSQYRQQWARLHRRPVAFAPRKVWKRVRVTDDLEDQATKWSHPLRYLHQELGYNPPGFDLDNDRYVARAHPDYSTIAGDQIIAFESGDGMLLPGINIEPDPSETGNRAIVQARNAKGQFNDIGVADLDVLVPGHQYSHNVIRHYRDIVSTSSTAGTALQLEARARVLLFRSLRSARAVSCTTRWHPAFDQHETVSLRIPSDSEFAVAQLCAEESEDFNMFTGLVDRDLRYLYIAAAIP